MSVNKPIRRALAASTTRRGSTTSPANFQCPLRLALLGPRDLRAGGPAYAGFDAPVVNIKGPGCLILGDHFSPIVALLAPLYWVWPSAAALLFAQAALFALGAAVVGRTAQQVLGGRSGLCVTVAYGLSWGIQEAVKADFHEIAFAVPLLALVCRALLLERYTAALLWSLPLVLVKEDLGATVAVVGFLLFVYGRRLQGALLAAFGVAAFVVTLMVLIPAASGAGTYDYWQKIDKNGEQDVSMLDTVLGVLNSLVKIEMLVFLLGITGFLALRSPLTLLIVPTLGWRLLWQDSNRWGMVWHYKRDPHAGALPRAGRRRPPQPRFAPPLARLVRQGRRPRRGRDRRRDDPAPAAARSVAPGDLPHRRRPQPDGAGGARRHPAGIAGRDGHHADGPPHLRPHRLLGRRSARHRARHRRHQPRLRRSRPIEDPVAYAEQLHPEARYRLKHRAGSFVVMERTTPAPDRFR
ncbi:hypothetical protein SCALM49S_06108 [Streptomyces californicus]